MPYLVVALLTAAGIYTLSRPLLFITFCFIAVVAFYLGHQDGVASVENEKILSDSDVEV